MKKSNQKVSKHEKLWTLEIVNPATVAPTTKLQVTNILPWKSQESPLNFYQIKLL